MIGRLGDGGFGEIFEGLAPGGQRVAVKRMRRELALRAEAILRFEREIEVIRRIGHHNVVEILDVGDDGAPYFTMELLHGVDLWRQVREVGRLTPAETLAVLEPLARALDAAHAKGVVHRDLKASNVFLDRCRVVLLDFGVAKLLDDGGPRLTRSRIQVGTPSCMAPEQILGLPVDARTDVYGLGVLAHHMLTGRPPFSHDHPTVVRQMHLAEAAPPVSRRAPVGVEVDRVVARAMSKEPAARQTSASALVAELEAATRGARAARGGEPTRSLAAHVDTASGDELPAIVGALVATGMAVAFEADNAVTLLAPLEAEAGAARLQRHRLLERATAAIGSTGAACFVGVGGAASLLRLGAWIPARPERGVLVMPEALDGIAAVVEAVPGQRLTRIVDLIGPIGRPEDKERETTMRSHTKERRGRGMVGAALGALLAVIAAGGCDLETGDEEPPTLTTLPLISMNSLEWENLADNLPSTRALVTSPLRQSSAIASLADTPEGVQVLRYAATCALRAGEMVKVQNNAGDVFELHGRLGVDPDWPSAAPTTHDIECTAGCMAAHLNGVGKQVEISVRGKGCGHRSEARERVFNFEEGAFAASNELQLFTCTGRHVEQQCGRRAPDAFKDRVCTQGHPGCGQIVDCGRCEDVCADWTLEGGYSGCKCNGMAVEMTTTFMEDGTVYPCGI